MQFPNAAKGVKKIFSAEIIVLFSVIFLGIGTTVALAARYNDALRTEAMEIASLAGLLAGAALILFALIFEFIGVVQASKDEDAFKGVIYLTMFNFAIQVANAFFTNNTVINPIASGASSVVSVITTVLIILGFCSIAGQLGKTDIVQKGKRILRIIICIAVISITLRLVLSFLPENLDEAGTFTRVLVLTLSVLSVMLHIAEYILFISFLSKSKKMLND